MLVLMSNQEKATLKKAARNTAIGAVGLTGINTACVLYIKKHMKEMQDDVNETVVETLGENNGLLKRAFEVISNKYDVDYDKLYLSLYDLSYSLRHPQKVLLCISKNVEKYFTDFWRWKYIRIALEALAEELFETEEEFEKLVSVVMNLTGGKEINAETVAFCNLMKTRSSLEAIVAESKELTEAGIAEGERIVADNN